MYSGSVHPGCELGTAVHYMELVYLSGNVRNDCRGRHKQTSDTVTRSNSFPFQNGENLVPFSCSSISSSVYVYLNLNEEICLTVIYLTLMLGSGQGKDRNKREIH